MSRTRKWPPSPSSPPVYAGSRSDERAATRARRFSVATTPLVGPCPSGDPGRSGAGAHKRVRFPPPDLWRPHRASYNRYVRGRETAASRAKAATLTTLKRDLGNDHRVTGRVSRLHCLRARRAPAGGSGPRRPGGRSLDQGRADEIAACRKVRLACRLNLNGRGAKTMNGKNVGDNMPVWPPDLFDFAFIKEFEQKLEELSALA